MGTLDLDVARAARAEARGDPHFIVVGGEKFELPPEIPWDYFEELDGGNMKGALEAVLDGQFDAFWAHRPSPEDVKELATGIPSLYGFGSNPELSASAGSSSTTSSRSRQTSPRAIKSTSAKRSGERRPSA